MCAVMGQAVPHPTEQECAVPCCVAAFAMSWRCVTGCRHVCSAVVRPLLPTSSSLSASLLSFFVSSRRDVTGVTQVVAAMAAVVDLTGAAVE